MVYFFCVCEVKFKTSIYPPPAGFHVLHILWIETLISAVTEETRRYLLNAYEPFNFDFVLLVLKKDVSHHD